MIRPPTLATLGIVGAVAGVVGLVAPPIWKSFQSAPEATIDAPTRDSTVARCFVAKGRVVPSSIRRPLWLLKAEAGHRWREVGRIYPPPGTWATRVCASDREVQTVRLALILADDRLDAALSRIVPEPEPEEEIPEWLKRNYSEQQGGRGRWRGFAGLPAGATPVTSVVDVRLVGSPDPYGYLALQGRLSLGPLASDPVRPKERGRRHSPTARLVNAPRRMMHAER